MRLESAKLLWDASEAAKAVRTFTDGVTKDQFFTELLLRSAVERQVDPALSAQAIQKYRLHDVTAGTSERAGR